MTGSRRGVLLASAVLVVTPVAMFARPVPVQAAPAFAATDTAAVWNGNQLTVKFRETGAKPWATGMVSIRATGTIDLSCVGGGISFSSQASSTTEVVAEHKANGAGVRTGEQVVGLAVQPPVVTGLGCKPRLSRSFTVIVRDLETGAVQSLAGPAAGTKPGNLT